MDFSHRQIAWTQLLISASILCLALGVKIAWAKMRLQKLRHSLLLASVRSCNWNNRKCSRWGTPTAAQANDGIWGTCVCSMGLPPSLPTPHKGSGASHQILGIWDRDGLKGSKLGVGSNFMPQLGEASWPTWNMCTKLSQLQLQSVNQRWNIPDIWQECGLLRESMTCGFSWQEYWS